MPKSPVKRHSVKKSTKKVNRKTRKVVRKSSVLFRMSSSPLSASWVVVQNSPVTPKKKTSSPKSQSPRRSPSPKRSSSPKRSPSPKRVGLQYILKGRSLNKETAERLAKERFGPRFGRRF